MHQIEQYVPVLAQPWAYNITLPPEGPELFGQGVDFFISGYAFERHEHRLQESVPDSFDILGVKFNFRIGILTKSPSQSLAQFLSHSLDQWL